MEVAGPRRLLALRLQSSWEHFDLSGESFPYFAATLCRIGPVFFPHEACAV
jgi:hypothetical protein